MTNTFTAADHTFVVCAYQENPYLEDTVISLKGQTVESNIIVSTSTPNAHIDGVCERQGVPLIVNPNPRSAGDDWNYGFDHADTPLVTIAHQDDYYEHDFLEIVLDTMNAADEEPGITFTDYYELRNNALVLDNTLLAIKRVMNQPFALGRANNSRFAKRRVLAFGDSICCPAVTYNKRVTGDTIFDTKYRNSCDYQTFVNLANSDASFIYIPAPLVGHRIYEESATTRNLADNIRKKEDLEILSSLWPAPIARIVNNAYALSEKSNELDRSEKPEEAAGDEASSLLAELKQYSLSDIAGMGRSFALTKVFYPGARLVRRPITVRGKDKLEYGAGFTTGKGCRIESFNGGLIKVGRDVHIGDYVHIAAAERIEIGDNCLFASHIFISDLSHGSYGANGSNPAMPPNDRPLSTTPVRIGKNVWLGENVTILQGVTIGDGCVIGSGAIVTKDIPDNCIAVGAPARPIKRYNAETGAWERI